MARTAKMVTTAEPRPRTRLGRGRVARGVRERRAVKGAAGTASAIRSVRVLFSSDTGGFKHAPYESGDLVYGLLTPGGLLVMDDLTPGWSAFDPSVPGRTATPRYEQRRS